MAVHVVARVCSLYRGTVVLLGVETIYFIVLLALFETIYVCVAWWSSFCHFLHVLFVYLSRRGQHEYFEQSVCPSVTIVSTKSPDLEF